MDRILGAILAGGRSRRFGGDKALATADGISLIDRAHAGIAPWVDAVVVCGRNHGAMVGLPDRPGGGLGPLAGLNAALHHAGASGFDRVLTIACDIPELSPAIVTALLAGGARVVREQPMLGCWPVALRDRLDAHLSRIDDRSMRGWIAAAGARAIGHDGAPIPNINTPGDLAAYASGLMRRSGGGA